MWVIESTSSTLSQFTDCAYSIADVAWKHMENNPVLGHKLYISDLSKDKCNWVFFIKMKQKIKTHSWRHMEILISIYTVIRI